MKTKRVNNAMRYLMKQRLALWGDDFYIENSERRRVYFVDGKATRLYGKLSFTDLEGNELAYIRERIIALRNMCHIYQNRRVVATIKRLTIPEVHNRFIMQVNGETLWKTRGNPLHFEYTILAQQDVIATVSKRWFSQPGTYGVEIASADVMSAAEQIKLLVATVVIDIMTHSIDMMSQSL